MPMLHADRVQSLYNQEYANRFEALYLNALPEKHILNVLNLKRALAGLRAPGIRWLDLACGQAWHFAQFKQPIDKVGVDLSRHQLERAARRNPGAAFLCADICKPLFLPASFDLVTNFWAGYCYLDDVDLIDTALAQAVGWIRPRGAFYMEVLAPEDVCKFNESEYSKKTGFTVEARTPDCVKWGYHDTGGYHSMTSPHLHVFTDILQEAFRDVESRHDTGFMFHVLGRNKRG